MNYCEEQLKAAESKVWKERIRWVNNSLRSCPCCGGKAEIKKGYRNSDDCVYRTIYVQCTQCGLRTKELITDRYYDDLHIPEEVAELWNRRYSGISDRNGTPICEGDHIRIGGIYWADYILGEYEVCYSDTNFNWYLKKLIDNLDYHGDRLFSFDEFNISKFTHEIEVVKED